MAEAHAATGASTATVKEESVASRFGSDNFLANFRVAGLRVLVVDDDPLCLKVVDQMLRRCNYAVTTCTNATVALQTLRDKSQEFDLVLSDVHMPDMDGFKLLELVGLELELPVIMMSSNGETSTVLRGVTHGAVDFLIKPVRIEELRNLWQHVVRRRKDLAHAAHSDSEEPSEDLGENSRKRKECSSMPVDSGGRMTDEDGSAFKKSRVVWSVEMHQKFVNAVNQLGIDKAVPKKILELMNVDSLTRENVASHLQKYRLYLKRVSGVKDGSGGAGGSAGGAGEDFDASGGAGGGGPSARTDQGSNASASGSGRMPNGVLHQVDVAAGAAAVQPVPSSRVALLSPPLPASGDHLGCLARPGPVPFNPGLLANPMAMMAGPTPALNPLLAGLGPMPNALGPLQLQSMQSQLGMLGGQGGMTSMPMPGMHHPQVPGLPNIHPMAGMPGMQPMPFMAGMNMQAMGQMLNGGFGMPGTGLMGSAPGTAPGTHVFSQPSSTPARRSSTPQQFNSRGATQAFSGSTTPQHFSSSGVVQQAQQPFGASGAPQPPFSVGGLQQQPQQQQPFSGSGNSQQLFVSNPQQQPFGSGMQQQQQPLHASIPQQPFTSGGAQQPYGSSNAAVATTSSGHHHVQSSGPGAGRRAGLNSVAGGTPGLGAILSGPPTANISASALNGRPGSSNMAAELAILTDPNFGGGSGMLDGGLAMGGSSGDIRSRPSSSSQVMAVHTDGAGHLQLDNAEIAAAFNDLYNSGPNTGNLMGEAMPDVKGPSDGAAMDDLLNFFFKG